jgi:hypothetical protein
MNPKGREEGEVNNMIIDNYFLFSDSGASAPTSLSS